MSNAYNRAVKRAKRAYLAKQEEPVRRRLMRLDALQLLFMLPGLAFGFSCIFTDPVNVLVKLLHTHPDTTYLVTVNPGVLGIPYILVGFLPFYVAMVLLMSRLAGTYRDKWEEYCNLGTSSKSFDNAVQIFGCTFLLGCVLMLLMSVGAFLVVSRDGVEVNHFWGVGTSRYNWSQIESVQQVYSGKHFRYRIVFADGNDWTSGDSSFKSTYTVAAPAVDYVSSMSGKEIEHSWQDDGE